MLRQVLQEAEESLREALKERADYYARGKVLETEQLILEARRISRVDSVQAIDLLAQAKQKAAEASTIAEAERLKLKKVYGETLASYFHKLSELKRSLETIKRRMNRANYLSINQRIEIAARELPKIRQEIDREDFQEVGHLLERLQGMFNDIDELILPLLERLSYETPLVNLSPHHRGKDHDKKKGKE
jgi:transposase